MAAVSMPTENDNLQKWEPAGQGAVEASGEKMRSMEVDVRLSWLTAVGILGEYGEEGSPLTTLNCLGFV